MRNAYRFLIVVAASIIGSTACAAGPRLRNEVTWAAFGGRVDVDLDFFHDALAPYGTWRVVPEYGEVWIPRVSPWWRPYTEGRWVMTDDGWTWISDEEWGWAPFHYGRWVDDPYYGWLWVPDMEWGPAWVAWRYGDDCIGWAPLPPRARWEVGVGFSGLDVDAWIGSGAWVFVDERWFCDPGLRERILPEARNVTLVRRTRDVTRYSIVDHHVFNRGVDVAQVEHVIGHAVPRYRVSERAGVEALRQRPPGRDEIVAVRPPARAAEASRRRAEARSVEPPAERRVQPPEPPRARSSEETARLYEQQRRELEAHQAEERSRLDRLHAEERQRQAAQGAAAERQREAANAAAELHQRHEAERQAQAQQQARQRELLARRQGREPERQATNGPSRPQPHNGHEKPRKEDKR